MEYSSTYNNNNYNNKRSIHGDCDGVFCVFLLQIKFSLSKDNEIVYKSESKRSKYVQYQINSNFVCFSKRRNKNSFKNKSETKWNEMNCTHFALCMEMLWSSWLGKSLFDGVRPLPLAHNSVLLWLMVLFCLCRWVWIGLGSIGTFCFSFLFYVQSLL